MPTTAAPAEPTRRLASEFDWPEDDAATSGTTTTTTTTTTTSNKFLPSGLDVPPPSAN